MKQSFFALLLLVVPVAVAQVYTITDIGTLPSGSFTSAYGINNLGRVVGKADIVNSSGLTRERAFLWTRSGGLQDLGTLPSSDPSAEKFFSSWGNAINDLGLVSGGSWHDIATDHGFLWSPAAGMQDLGTAPTPGNAGSNAQSINLWGQVVGTAFEPPGDVTPASPPHAFLWTKNGGMELLPNLSNGQYSEARSINNFGQIVGIADAGGSAHCCNFHAFLWTRANSTVDIGSWSAVAINNFGKIVGDESRPDGSRHAAIWTRTQGLQDLGTLPGGNSSSASAINDFSQVVGWSNSSGSPSIAHATLWSSSSGTWDLNDLIPPNTGWVLYAATGINAWGQIVGYGAINGQTHAFIVTPNLLFEGGRSR